MNRFIFESIDFMPYDFDSTTGEASFRYCFSDGRSFCERVTFTLGQYDEALLERALHLAWLLIGTSYYKCFPTREVSLTDYAIDSWQAQFLNTVYQEGMSQFAYENGLKREDLARFVATRDSTMAPMPYAGKGILALQSGGKDSLLMAQLLKDAGHAFDTFYISSRETVPSVLQEVGEKLLVTTRSIDIPAIKQAQVDGGLNGHVPVTYIVLSLGLIQAILSGKKTVIASIGHEGEEPHAMIGDLPVNHQWSKTWPAEQLFAEYVTRYISPDIQIGSPLRSLTELRISQLFAQKAWNRFSRKFSSCNLANYKQGADNTHLDWCGECPKCANAFLLFAPFVESSELKEIFGGQDLFAKASLQETFKGLLGVEGVMKPFECVGEIDELRHAYHISRSRHYAALSFDVPDSNFNVNALYPSQEWAKLEEL